MIDDKDTKVKEKVVEEKVVEEKVVEEKVVEEKVIEEKVIKKKLTTKEKAAEKNKALPYDEVDVSMLSKAEYNEHKMIPRKKLYVVKVNHLLAEGKARDSAISVNDLGDHAHGKALCYPNKEAVLSQVQINILKEAIEVIDVTVPEGSGIYEATNPLAAAEQQFPQFVAFRDRATGMIKLQKQNARFAVEIIRPYDKEKEMAKAAKAAKAAAK